MGRPSLSAFSLAPRVSAQNDDRSTIPPASPWPSAAKGTKNTRLLAPMRGLLRSQHYSTEGHLSAHGMPHRPCLIVPRAVPRGWTSLATAVSFVVPLVGGLRSCCESPVPALSTGTGYFRRSSRGPRRMEGGVGKCAGGNGPIVSGESASAARLEKQRC
jgi:hypothetical protein